MDKIIEKELFLRREGLDIYVREFISADIWESIAGNNNESIKVPAIIVSHGFGGNSTGHEKYCQDFAKHGYAAYCFDFCGGSRDGEGKSQGDSMNMTIETECLDLITVFHMVKSLSYIDTSISLMGSSQGGFVSALAAAQLNNQIDKLVLLFPALCIPDDARRGKLGGSVYDAENVPDVIYCPNKIRISRKFHENVVNMDPFKEIAEFKGKVLLIQGMEDSTVNYSYAIKARESYMKGQCHLHLIRAAGHCFTDKLQASAIVAIHQFLHGKKELLTINVIKTGFAEIEESECFHKSAVYFTGYCDTDIFKGCILPVGVDIQEQHKEEEKAVRADYTLVGIDASENTCSVHVVNQKRGEYFKPVIETDSAELSFLSEADLTATLEGFPGGLTVRIFG